MALETGSYINDLVITNPVSSDPKSQGDDHFQLIKKVLKECLNGFTGAILLTATDTGTAAAHVLTPTTALVGYTTGLMLLYRPTNTGTGALTVNVSGLGAKSVKTIAGADPTSGDILVNQPILLMYDGTNFVLLAGSEYLSKTGNQTLTGNLTLTGAQTVSGTLGVTGVATFTAGPVGPTATPGTNTTQLATTAFVQEAVFGTAFTGTIAQLNAAVTDADVAILAGNTFTGAQNFARATVASHATTADIWGAAGNQIDWTGTATTTAFPAAPQAGAERALICAGACSFTAGANMLIDGVASGATVTCAANDTVIVRAVTTTQFKLSRVKYDGMAQVGSSLVYLSTITASGAATVDVETGISSLYDDYLLIGHNVVPATDGSAIYAQLKMGGSYLSGATDYTRHLTYVSDQSSLYVGTATTGTTRLNLAIAVGNAADESLNFDMYIRNANSTSRRKMITAIGNYVDDSGFLYGMRCDGGVKTSVSTAAITGIRIASASGNISGTFKLYGIAKS